MAGIFFFLNLQAISSGFLFGWMQKSNTVQELTNSDKLHDFTNDNIEEKTLYMVKSYYRGFLEMRESNFGKMYINLAKNLKDKGLNYYSLSQYHQAEKYLLWCLELEELNFNLNHPSLAETSKYLGFMYYDLSDFDQSEKYLLRSLEIHKLNSVQNHAEMSLILINLLLVYNEIGSIYQQLQYWDEFLVVLKLSFKTDKYSWSYFSSFVPYVKNYKELSKFLNIIKKKLGRSVWMITEACKTLNLKQTAYNVLKSFMAEVFSDSVKLLLT